MKNTLKVERAIKNITQAELADLVKVSRQNINAVETGKYVPSTVLALKIALVFGKKVEDIFILEDSDWELKIKINFDWTFLEGIPSEQIFKNDSTRIF